MTKVMIRRWIRVNSKLGCSVCSLHDPNASQGSESGADVLAVLDGKRYGIQVTTLHPDEGLGPIQKGSELRRQETKFRNSVAPYAA